MSRASRGKESDLEFQEAVYEKACVPMLSILHSLFFCSFIDTVHLEACFHFYKHSAVIIRKPWSRVKNLFRTNTYKIIKESKGGFHFTAVSGISLSLQAGNAME